MGVRAGRYTTGGDLQEFVTAIDAVVVPMMCLLGSSYAVTYDAAMGIILRGSDLLFTFSGSCDAGGQESCDSDPIEAVYPLRKGTAIILCFVLLPPSNTVAGQTIIDGLWKSVNPESQHGDVVVVADVTWN